MTDDARCITAGVVATGRLSGESASRGAARALLDGKPRALRLAPFALMQET